MATRIEAARALVYTVARYIGSSPKDYAKEGAMAKLFPTDMAMQVTVDAVQVMGGHGYMREYPVEKMIRDAKILQIYEGTNQIMRNIIGLALNRIWVDGQSRLGGCLVWAIANIYDAAFRNNSLNFSSQTADNSSRKICPRAPLPLPPDIGYRRNLACG